jgi:hypothetical protein
MCSGPHRNEAVLGWCCVLVDEHRFRARPATIVRSRQHGIASMTRSLWLAQPLRPERAILGGAQVLPASLLVVRLLGHR